MKTVTSPAVSNVPSEGALGGPSRRLHAGHALLRKPIALVSGSYLILLITAVLAAPLIAPYSPGTQDLAHVLAGPSSAHLLGTDQLGRDIVSRLLYGGQAALADVAIALMSFLVASIPIGIIAGYKGGWIDRITMRVADLLFAVPAIIVLLMVVAVFPGDDAAAMIAFGIMSAPGLLRLVRGSTLAIRGELYVKAAVLSGLRTTSILRRHILPNLAGPIIVQMSLFCAGALIAESGLSFLGLLRPDASGPSWGNMVADAANTLNQDSWMLLPTGGVIAITVLAFSLLGDAVRDATVGRSTATATLRQYTARGAHGVKVGPRAGESLLEVSGLSVTLPRAGIDTTVVRDVSFAVAPGEAVGLVGESGCGKSITAKAILGLLPPGGRVTAGSVFFGGADLTLLSEKSLSRKRGSQVAFVSQDAMNSLDPTYTVGNQLREVIRRHTGVTRRMADQRAAELLRQVQLPEPDAVLSHRVHQLSGGMAQRVGIAMALAGGPKLLIADEPTTALDVTVQAEILALLRDLRRKLDMALILVTHDWAVLADVCDRTIVMYAGEIVEVAGVDQMYAAPRHPYSSALLASHPQLVRSGEPLPTIPGRVPDPSAWPDGCHFQPRCPHATDECAAARIPLLALADGRASRCIHADQVQQRQ
ncbi:MAG: dipeptide/oligopeptide/nickel ABC transporter permease/ATP-binding protein [Acidimicrobiales bacterium]